MSFSAGNYSKKQFIWEHDSMNWFEAQKISDKIIAELNDVQGKAVDIAGYFLPDFDKATAAMRPSATLNKTLASL